MPEVDRRRFLQLTGGSAALSLLTPSIARAASIPANRRTGSLDDVEHIVVLMQENRSFDHYFGTLRGVRGFGDPRAVFQRDGRSIFAQPHDDGHVLPFRPDVPELGMQFIEGLAHDWNTTHDAFNRGAWDRWIAAKGTTTMAHLTRADLPFYHALADAFTICDAYHCSLLGPTDPNRFYAWSGCTGNLGPGSSPVVDNAEAGYSWTTFPERLERAGVSWKVYQDVGGGLDAGNYWGWTGDALIGNYGDNPLLYFRRFQDALPGEALYEKARRGTRAAGGEDLFARFRADVAGGSLPQVSWIVAPEAFSEHPNWPAAAGAGYVGAILDAQTANPDVWSKTVFLLTYDENDGFFDHVPPPFAPSARSEGLSTIPCDDEIHAGDATWQPGPYGLGPRVPMLAISPWSRGGYVNSQVFDHTSIIRFIEQRFAATNGDVVETNISAWRRAVCGDLTTAFDFAHPNAAFPRLTAPAAPVARPTRQPGWQPAPQPFALMPRQEPGIRRARALPYRLEADGRWLDGAFRLTMRNPGDAAAVFHVRSRTHAGGPRVYTIGAGATIVENWPLHAAGDDYEFSVHGPNGFLRRFRSADGGLVVEPQVEIRTHAGDALVRIALLNPGSAALDIVVTDAYMGVARVLTLEPAQPVESTWDTTASLRWYDLRIADARDGRFRRQFAGYVENGLDGYSDPAIGAVVALDDDF
jgi:phospholipase C